MKPDKPTIAKLAEKARQIQRAQNKQHTGDWWDVLSTEDQQTLRDLSNGLFHVEPANTP